MSTGETHDTMAGFQARVLSGEIAVADLKIVREIVDTSDESNTTKPRDIDIAEFSGLLADYEIEGYNALSGIATDTDGDGFISVTHLTRDATGAVVRRRLWHRRRRPIEEHRTRCCSPTAAIKITRHENRIAEGRATVTGGQSMVRPRWANRSQQRPSPTSPIAMA